MHGTFATRFPRFLAAFVPFGTFATDMVLLRRGGSFVAKLENHHENHHLIQHGRQRR